MAATTDLAEVMRTTFAARDFTDDPVPDADLHAILDLARFGPSGGNRQGWRVVVVRELGTRDALLPLIRTGAQRYVAQLKAGENPWNTIVPSRLSDAEIAASELNDGFVRKLLGAPVLLFVFVDLAVVASMDSPLERIGVISGGSIYPFAWNICLAARSRGYGGTMTTFLAPEEPRLQDLLGVPSQYAFATMIPLGRPVKQLTKLTRNPVEAFATLERFDGPPLTPASEDPED